MTAAIPPMSLPAGLDPDEAREWLEALGDVLRIQGPEAAHSNSADPGSAEMYIL